MYEETIEGLRKIVQEHKGRLTPYMRLTICKAADAIEELSRLAEINAKRAMKWAADAEKVRHGRWHDVYLSGASSFVGTCSVCGKSNDIPPVPLAKYCPSCGAKMDGGQDDGMDIGV